MVKHRPTSIMEYMYAALLLHKLKQDISEDNIRNVIKATGTVPDDVRIKSLVTALGEVNIDEALKSTPVSMPSPVTSPNAASPQPESKVEEKKEEKKEEEALEGLSALFG
jgi:large subunit ribosomal protein L12